MSTFKKILDKLRGEKFDFNSKEILEMKEKIKQATSIKELKQLENEVSALFKSLKNNGVGDTMALAMQFDTLMSDQEKKIKK